MTLCVALGSRLKAAVVPPLLVLYVKRIVDAPECVTLSAVLTVIVVPATTVTMRVAVMLVCDHVPTVILKAPLKVKAESGSVTAPVTVNAPDSVTAVPVLVSAPNVTGKAPLNEGLLISARVPVPDNALNSAQVIVPLRVKLFNDIPARLNVVPVALLVMVEPVTVIEPDE